MTAKIHFDTETQVFHLTNGRISYIMELIQDKYLAHRYWGRALKSYQKANQVPMYKKTFAAFADPENPAFSLEFLPQEFPHAYQGDYKQAAISISQPDGNDMLRLRYEKFQLSDGLPTIPDLPHAREFADDSAMTLMIRLRDDIAQLEVDLFYSIFDSSDVIVRSSKITYLGQKSLTVNHLASASFDMAYDQQQVTSQYGSHQKEFQIQTQAIQHGQFRTGTSRGASGPQYLPFVALSEHASETSGDVHAMTLIYSGNHLELVERDQYDQLRLQIGLNPEQFAWTLHPNDSFYSPQAVLVYSPDGFNGMSQQFHSFTDKHLVHPRFRQHTAPILINSWEMTYFDVDERKISFLIDKAAQLGFEAIVVDDGWFLGRNNSKSSLGDWQVDLNKFPNDLFSLIKKCHDKNMKFGIWFEPEMISPDSNLIAQHPDWVMKAAHYSVLYGRSQYVLDLSQTAVQDFTIKTLSDFIQTYQVDYIKWDMNRHITEPFSQNDYSQHPKAYSHQYILGLYRIINQLTNQFPQVLFENCSSGGGRFDYGMLYYFPQTWASDNTDGLDRQAIQYGASYLFHPYQMTGHVSTTPNHQTQRETPLTTRMNLASSSNMGYELNILEYKQENDEETIAHIKEYKADRETIRNGKFYRLLSPFSSNKCAWLFENQEQTSYILTVFHNRYEVNNHHHIVKIPYLDLNKDYYISEYDRVISGSELSFSGIHLLFEKQDWESIQLHLSVVE